MNIQRKYRDTNHHEARNAPGCAVCPAFALGLCDATPEPIGQYPQIARTFVTQSDQIIPTRRMIYRERDLCEAVPIICEGWAASALTLSNGRRQILSFLLPGDIVSTALIFSSTAHCLVEAITDVRCRVFKRAELKAILFKNPEFFETRSGVWVDEKQRSDQLAIDLGRRTAEERIVRLILSLQERLRKRNMADGQTIDFPLRQHHIADATGLTAVHVSKVLSEFRRNGLVEINDRSLMVLDPANMHRIAAMR